MSPQSLNLNGSTQPEIFRQTVDDMVAALRADAARFWRDSLAADGPLEIWEINGQRYLSNGNHRFQAALAIAAEIPDEMIVEPDMTGSGVLVFRFDQMTWLSGRK